MSYRPLPQHAARGRRGEISPCKNNKDVREVSEVMENLGDDWRCETGTSATAKVDQTALPAKSDGGRLDTGAEEIIH